MADTATQSSTESQRSSFADVAEQLRSQQVTQPVIVGPHEDSILDVFRGVASKLAEVADKVAWKLVGEYRADRDLTELANDLTRNKEVLATQELLKSSELWEKIAGTYKDPQHGLPVDTILGSVASILSAYSNNGRAAIEPLTEKVKNILGDKYPVGGDVVEVLSNAKSLDLNRAQKEALRDFYRNDFPEALAELSAKTASSQAILDAFNGKDGVLGFIEQDQHFLNTSSLFASDAALPLNARQGLQSHFNQKREEIITKLADGLHDLGPNANPEAVVVQAVTAQERLNALHEKTNATVDSLRTASETLASIRESYAAYEGVTRDGTKYARIPDASNPDMALVPSKSVGEGMLAFWNATVGVAQRQFSGALAAYLSAPDNGTESLLSTIPALTKACDTFRDGMTSVGKAIASIAEAEDKSSGQTLSARAMLLERIPEAAQQAAVAKVFDKAKREIENDVVASLQKAALDPSTLGRDLQSVKWKSDLIDGYSLGVISAPEQEAAIARGYARAMKRISKLGSDLEKASDLPAESLITKALKEKFAHASPAFFELCKKEADAEAGFKFAAASTGDSFFLSEVKRLTPEPDLIKNAREMLKLLAKMPEAQRAQAEKIFADSILA